VESLNRDEIELFFAGFFMIFILCLLTFALYYGGIKLEDQYVPEAINGIASAVALILGSTGVILTIVLQRGVEDWKAYIKVLVFGVFAVLVIPISALFASYISLFGGYFRGAVDGAIISLLSANIIFIILLCLVVWLATKKWIE
jgi:hypothetical protein